MPEHVDDELAGFAFGGDLRHQLARARYIGVELYAGILFEELIFQRSDKRILHRCVDGELFRRHRRA
ncbi:hypothetical protein SDC9_110469 [bioreactor metagenome]|uniref:Uncharacterized protein n=1 Tax=bioreactor metagenome TaxID=1076179 RepID=A0A645BEV7_9ZZZZ